MKRYKATVIKYSEIDKAQFNTKLEISKTIFYDTAEYKNSKKDYENALKAYDDAVLKDDSKADIDAFLITLEDCKAIYETVLINEPKQFMEDSGEICPQLGERVLFLEDYKEIDILEKEIIQLSTPFYFDTGTECITITKENYKDYDITKVLKEKPEKYKIELI